MYNLLQSKKTSVAIDGQKNEINKHQTNRNYVDYIKKDLLNALFKQAIIAKIF